MLIKNTKLYDALQFALAGLYTGGAFIHVLAIYEPDDGGGDHEGMSHAAVDMTEPGETYHVWFVVNDDDSIIINDRKRWFMG